LPRSVRSDGQTEKLSLALTLPTCEICSRLPQNGDLRMLASRFLLAACFGAVCLLSELADAAEPGFYAVTGVASGDVLNIREEPDANAAIVESLEPGASPVEILETITKGGGEWGRVLAGDGNGWVSMRFLDPVDVPVLAGTEIPDGLSCGGTEPFWGARITASGGIVFAPMDGTETALPIEKATNAIGRNTRFAVLARSGDMSARAMLARFESCSDGMSDREFGWRIDLLLEKPGDASYPQLYEGCCRLPVAR
jgi:uncharacterized membrane protein